MAVKDAYKSPEVQNIQFEETIVVVTASDEFKVAEVIVRILDAGGSMLERGKAVPARNGIQWYYQANNLPGNETVREVNIAGTSPDY